jgi:hypothetical protein
MKGVEEWISTTCPSALFEGENVQVKGFRRAKGETLEEVKRELARRKDREVENGDKEEYEVVRAGGESGKEDGEGVGMAGSAHTKQALEEAAEAGRRVAEEAKMLDEWDLVD